MPREFYRRLTAFRQRLEREDEAAWSRSLLVANQVRMLLRLTAGKKGRGIKPITLEQLKRRRGVGRASRAEYAALCAEIDRRRARGTRRVLN